jgi:excinuclease UvrABC nuclease subunit
MRWDPRDGNDARVVDRGAWCDTWSIEGNFPEQAGVYIFAYVDAQVKYVGRAAAGRLRAEAMAAVASDKARGATRAMWLATDSEAFAQSLERDLITKYEPPNNAA